MDCVKLLVDYTGIKRQCSLAGGFSSLPSTAECDTPIAWGDLNYNSLLGHNTT